MFCGKQVSSWHGTTIQAVQPILHAPQQHSPMDEDIPGPENVEALPCPCSPSTHGECTAVGVSDMQESNRHMECALPENIPMLSRRKRSISIRSPHKPTILAIPKTKRRARTGTEGISNIPPPSPVDFPVPQSRYTRGCTDTMNMEKFHLNSREQCAIDNLQKEMDTYILQKYTQFSSGAVPCNSSILSIQDYMQVISPVSVEKSNIVYMQVLDAKSESKDTLMTIFFDLHQRFIEQRGN